MWDPLTGKDRWDHLTRKIDLSNNPFSKLNSSKDLKIASINVNNLLKNIDQLRIIMQNSSFAILAINETKIDDTVSDNEISIPGYYHIRKDRTRFEGEGEESYYMSTNHYHVPNEMTFLVSNSL